jgi:RNA polymerase sigma-70 factor (ECF subfamily)
MQGETFQDLRGLMFSIAYRMTGSVSDAEDIAQEAFFRLERTRREGREVESPRAWLSAVTTRIAIDHLRSARHRRESYVGPWLPEPLLTDPAPGPEEQAETSDSLSQAFLLVLETLSPVERAVFLLHDVFGYDYPSVAAAVDKDEQNCRQIASRARRRVDERRPRFDPDPVHREQLLDRFLAASETGDTDELRRMLADDAVLYSDGGGKAVAARRPILGADRVARLMVGVTRKRLGRPGPGPEERLTTVNGMPGRALLNRDGSVQEVLSIDVVGNRIQTVRITRNPEKLAHLRPEGLAAARG